MTWFVDANTNRSTEPAAFFAPLRDAFELHFVEEYEREYSQIGTNYGVYAVETLLFFGSVAHGMPSPWMERRSLGAL